jgi:hypothetical protein
MDRERFLQMIEAYGADPRRWPQAERAEGLRFAARETDGPTGRGLERARALDASLDAWTSAAPSLALRARIAVQGPSAAPASRALALPAGRLWISGAGLAAACAAGVLVGATFGGTGLGAGLLFQDRDAEALSGGLDGVAVFGSRLDGGTNS